MNRQPISDYELMQKCKEVIQAKKSMNSMLMNLRANQIQISDVRLRQMWVACRGPIRVVNRRY